MLINVKIPTIGILAFISMINTIQEFKASGSRREKTCLRGFANKTGADQPAHPCSLISAFVVRFLESTVCKFATGKISFF